MDEFLKGLLHLQQQMVDATFTYAKAKMDLVHARREHQETRAKFAPTSKSNPVMMGSFEVLFTVETNTIEAESRYYTKVAALAGKQLEQAKRMLESEGGLDA